MPHTPSGRCLKFGDFELDLLTRELHKGRRRLKLPEQSIQILELLLAHPGDLVGRDQLRERLWPTGTFVDFDHGVNTAVRRLRDALGDSAETPRFIETLPRRGYRFIGAIGESIPPTPVGTAPLAPASTTLPPDRQPWSKRSLVFGLLGAVVVFGIAVWFVLRSPGRVANAFPSLSAVTFEEGIQNQPTWSPDGQFIAYASNQSGNFDIWVQAAAGGEPHRLTTNSDHDWQPAWSPDGKSIAFRSERNGGGIFSVPAPLGGDEMQLSDVGYWPQWSRDRKLMVLSRVGGGPKIYLLDPDRPQSRRQILREELANFDMRTRIVWHPDGQRVSFWGVRKAPSGLTFGFWTFPIAGGEARLSEIPESVWQEAAQFGMRELSAVTWAPKGDALYLQAESNGVQNIWTLDVDPVTLRWRGGLREVTRGTENASALSVASDGDKLTFVVTTPIVRLWSLPLEPRTGRPTGEAPTAMTPPSMRVYGFDLSADGSTLVYVAKFPGRPGSQLLSRSFDGRPPTKLAEGVELFGPRLSFDGGQLVYRLKRSRSEPVQLVLRATDGTGVERGLPHNIDPSGWSRDGKRILHGCPNPKSNGTLCISPVNAANLDQTREVLNDPIYSYWQGRFSPNDRWILFNAIRPGEGSVLGVVPAEAGDRKWIPLTEAGLGADKARWAPDGKAIYFIGSQNPEVNHVWRIEFDPERGTIIGKPVKLTHYDDPAVTISKIGRAELGVSGNRLVVSIIETSSRIWKMQGIKDSPR